MKITLSPPPLFDEIDAAFNVRGQPVIFTWGDTIYNPQGVEVSLALHAHEGVHFSRQTNDTPAIERWWRQYIADPEFRLSEELPAHRAEYRTYCTLNRDRNRQARYLHAVAARMASPLYGGLISPRDARKAIAK